MAKTRGVVVVDVNRCKGCEICIDTCPHDVLANKTEMVNSKGYHYVYMEHIEDCTGCTNCAVVCPEGALTIYRKKIIQKKSIS